MTFADLTASIVDDGKTQVGKVRSVLARLGITVVSADCDGKAGLASIEALRPSIALLDIVMPHFSGLDVLRAIHRQGLPTLPIMATSMHVQSIKEECASLGAHFFIVKPYDDITTVIDLRKMLTEHFALEG